MSKHPLVKTTVSERGRPYPRLPGPNPGPCASLSGETSGGRDNGRFRGGADVAKDIARSFTLETGGESDPERLRLVKGAVLVLAQDPGAVDGSNQPVHGEPAVPESRQRGDRHLATALEL